MNAKTPLPTTADFDRARRWLNRTIGGQGIDGLRQNQEAALAAEFAAARAERPPYVLIPCATSVPPDPVKP